MLEGRRFQPVLASGNIPFPLTSEMAPCHGRVCPVLMSTGSRGHMLIYFCFKMEKERFGALHKAICFISVPFINTPSCLASDIVEDNVHASSYKFLIKQEVVQELICLE